MNAGKAVYGILSGTTAVTDIVGTRIFPEIAEQEAVTPFVIYQLQSVAPEDTHDGPSKLDEVRFEFLCYADSYNEAADLGVAVRGALDRVSGTYNGVNVESVQFNDVDVEIEYDPRRYSQVLKFTFRIKRDDIEIALGTPVTGAQLGDLSDVNVDGVTDNQILSYDAATDTWVPAADAGGANELSDLSDANVSLPSDGEVLIYSGGEFVNDNIAISNVTNLQSELDATPDSLDDLTDVKIVGTPQAGEALVYSSGFWQRGTAGASTLGDLTDVNTTGAAAGSLISYNGVDGWEISAAELPDDAVYYHNRYATQAETLRAGATATVELYYTAQADGDGLAESASSDTATAGYDIRRKLYYSEAAQADPDTGTWVQFATIPDDTTFASAKATLLAYLKERTGGTVPISLKMTWEEVAEAPAFTGLLNETYGSGASAAYSVRRLNGNYTGSAIQVERSSDNSYQDIGFDVDGNLDESALTTFCTGTVCKVRTWYDQSVTGGTGSGNDAVQTTHANQPTIYTGGAIVKDNGRVAVDFAGSGIYLSASSSMNLGTNDHLVTGAINVGTGGSNPVWFEEHAASLRYVLWRQSSNSTLQLYHNAVIGSGISSVDNQKYLVTATRVGTTSTLHVDSTNSTTGTAADFVSSGTLKIGINSIATAAASWQGKMQEIVAYTTDKSTDRTSIESNIGDYFTQNTPLLDTYTGAAAAYSLRKLRSAYSGSAIRVRRASDNTEQDIGFNVFGELDTVSLASFCSGTDGFVKTWYDQSGNGRDFAQTNTANQPKIYDSTTGVVTDNAKPAMEFDGANDTFNATSAFTINTDFLGAMVFNFTGANGIRMIHDSTNADRLSIFFCENLSTTFRPALKSGFSTESSGQNITLSTQTIITAHKSGTQAEAFANGQSNGASTVNNPSTSLGGLAFSSYGGLKFTGKMQEIVFYGDDQSSDRANIETNLNDFYGAF